MKRRNLILGFVIVALLLIGVFIIGLVLALI